MRVVFDTNIWISYLIGNSLEFLDDAIIDDEITILFSNELFDEFMSVARRPKFSELFDEKKYKT